MMKSVETPSEKAKKKQAQSTNHQEKEMLKQEGRDKEYAQKA